MVFPGAASRTAHWHAKVLTVLPELDAAAAAAGANGQAGRHHKVDRRADRHQLQLAAHFVHLAHGPNRAGVQSGANGRRGGRRPGEFRLPELGRPDRKEEPRQDPRHRAAHQPGVHVCSLSLAAWTGGHSPPLSRGERMTRGVLFAISKESIRKAIEKRDK